MIKRKIAVFSSGWCGDYFYEVMGGIQDMCKRNNIDVFAFVNFSVPIDVTHSNDSETNLFSLPDLNDFDGAILLANSFNDEKEVEYISDRIREAGIKAISIEYEIEGIPSIFTDNYAGMYELVEHIIVEHGKKNLVYIGGASDHPENIERCKAFNDALDNNGVVIPDNNIFHADWSKKTAVEMFVNWIDSNEGRVPEAVICANDIMAIGISEWLLDHGYNIPKDIVVTGYDCIQVAQEFKPAIASVNHEWGKMGILATETLLDMIDGKKPKHTVLKTSFVPNTSCGCTDKISVFDSKKLLRNDSAGYRVGAIELDSHFRHIYICIRKAGNIEDLHISLTERFKNGRLLEGNDFKIVLEPEFFNIVENDTNLRKTGYSDNLELVVSFIDGKSFPRKRVTKKEAIFETADAKEEPGFYMFCPLYSDNRVYGFAMLTAGAHIVCDNHLYIWTRHMNEYLEQVRRNITIENLTSRLTKLSVTDVLTGVYNRAGCEQLLYPMLEDWKKSGGTGAVMIVDIDKMKDINDNHGHACGDLALKTVVDVIKGEMPEGWIISRFGGDEFLLGGRVLDENLDISEFIQRCENKLEKEVKARGIPFNISVSMGGVKIKPEDDMSIEQFLQKADHFMYDEKQCHHRMLKK